MPQEAMLSILHVGGSGLWSSDPDTMTPLNNIMSDKADLLLVKRGGKKGLPKQSLSPPYQVC